MYGAFFSMILVKYGLFPGKNNRRLWPSGGFGVLKPLFFYPAGMNNTFIYRQ
jgi:hypothetical protein